MVEARIRTVGACCGNDVCDVCGRELCFVEGFSCGCYCERYTVCEEDFREQVDRGGGSGSSYYVVGSPNGGSGVDSCVLVYEEDLLDSGEKRR